MRALQAAEVLGASWTYEGRHICGDQICIVISIINLSTKNCSPVFVLGITLQHVRYIYIYIFLNSCWVFNTARLTFCAFCIAKARLGRTV